MAVVRIPPDLHAALLERAASEDRTIAAILRRAFNLYIAEQVRDREEARS
jgi:hypothetical protein